MHPSPEAVVRRSTLMAAGHSNYSVAVRCRPDGPWQQLLPGVLLLKSGPPTRRQRLKAAVLYAGADAQITGIESLRAHGLHAFNTDHLHLLIPSNRRLSSRDYVRVERTSRLPRPRIIKGLSYAPPYRAAIDAARHLRDPAEQRSLLYAPIESGLCTISQLRAELDAGAQRGTAALRTMLDEALPTTPKAAPRTTVHQGWAKRLLKDSALPQPQWHVPIHTTTGELVGIADAWWDTVALAWDFGNQRDNHARHRQEAFSRAGILTVRTDTPEQRDNPESIIRTLIHSYYKASNRPRPPIQAT